MLHQFPRSSALSQNATPSYFVENVMQKHEIKTTRWLGKEHNGGIQYLLFVHTISRASHAWNGKSETSDISLFLLFVL